MKGGQNLRELQQKREEAEGWVKPQPCHICKKMLKGAYGHTTLLCGLIWSCSGACEKVVQSLKLGESHDQVSRTAEAKA